MRMVLKESLRSEASEGGCAVSSLLQIALAAEGYQRTGLRCGPIVGVVALLLLTVSAQATNWYVDNAATGGNKGTSWANAWTSLTAIIGVQPGDTVYISGGSTSQTYPVNSWAPQGGTAGNPITYQTGQDAGHNGIVIFDAQGSASCLVPPSNAIVSGNFNGSMNMQFINSRDHLIQTSAVTTNLRLTYLNIPGNPDCIEFGADCSGIEIDHCSIVKSGPGSPDGALFLGYMVSAKGFDLVKIHDNYFQTLSNSTEPAYGDDAIEWGNGVSVYNNHFKVVLGNYPTTGDHADVLQIAGSYWKIYNNFFENIGESCIYHDQFDVPDRAHDFYVYNNVFWQNPNQFQSSVSRGLDLQPESGGVGTTFTDFYVANNVFANIVSQCFAIRINNAASYTRVNIVNNLFYNCNSPLVLDPGISVFFNKADSGPAGVNTANMGATNSSGPLTNNPVSYVNVSTGNMHLASGDTGAMGNGTNWPGTVPSFTFNTDKNGNPRPPAAWALGPYEPTSTLPPTSTPPPNSTPSPPRNLHIVPTR